MLAASKALAKISARSSNLSGTLPDLGHLRLVDFDGIRYAKYETPLSKSLQVLDLSSNRIQRVEGLNAQSLLSLAGNANVDITHGLLHQALQQGIRLDLTDVATTNVSEATELLATKALSRTDVRTITDAEGGFSCYGLQSAVLQVTPAQFLPSTLCGCQPGWHGTGLDCKPCRKDSYSDEFNQTQCKRCPEGSVTPDSGAASLQGCQCEIGRTPSTLQLFNDLLLMNTAELML